MSDEKPIEQRIWPMVNEILRSLPMECRISIIEEIVKNDVRICVENNGISDPICQSMAMEAGEMEEYLLSSESELHKFLKRWKCDKNPCDLTIKGEREELK